MLWPLAWTAEHVHVLTVYIECALIVHVCIVYGVYVCMCESIVCVVVVCVYLCM